jgi:aldehyde:ferredoxin oxidoreductase
MAIFGYAGRILRVDLSSGSTTEMSTLDYTDRFLGGRGIAARVYWDEIFPQMNAFDAGNKLIFVTGPLAGLPVLGGSRWQVCGKSPSPIPEQFCYCNLGGRWGAELKFAGYDAIVLQGKSERPVYVFLHDDIAELRDASSLWGKGSIETREILKGELGGSARVVAIGPAGENMVTMATLLADNDASGSGGMGAVMGSKKLKAIVVKGTNKEVKVAQPERFRELVKYYRELKVQAYRPGMAWGRDWLQTGPRTKREPCYGCLGNCIRVTYEAEDGKRGKFMCGSALFYQQWAEAYYGGPNDVPFYATKLCDDYGLDTAAVSLMILWLNRCYETGVLTDKDTGIPISKVGSLEFMETLVREVSLRDGIGEILAQGTVKAADSLGPRAREQITDYLSKHGADSYSPRLFITTALLTAMEPRRNMQIVHEVGLPVGRWMNWVKKTEGAHVSTDVLRAIAKRFWGSELAADFSTYQGKALATKMIQDRQMAKECLILCDYLWPITDLKYSEDHVGDPALESKILSAVTGNEVDEEGLYRIGERVFNLQRAILVRDGRGWREADTLPDIWHTMPKEGDHMNPECLMPGKGGRIISRKGAVVDKEAFERMKDEYYQLRQWDVATGLQTRAKLEELGLGDVAQDLDQRGLVA